MEKKSQLRKNYQFFSTKLSEMYDRNELLQQKIQTLEKQISSPSSQAHLLQKKALSLEQKIMALEEKNHNIEKNCKFFVDLSNILASSIRQVPETVCDILQTALSAVKRKEHVDIETALLFDHLPANISLPHHSLSPQLKKSIS